MVQNKSAPIYQINSISLSEILNDARVALIDVRTKQEIEDTGFIDGKNLIFAEYMIGDARRLNDDFQEEVSNKIAQIHSLAKLIFICRSGQRSQMAATLFQEYNYELFNYAPGILGWIAGGYQILKGKYE